MKFIWNNSYLNCGCRSKWRMIILVNFQFKQLERRSLKNIKASLGFEPVSSSIQVWRSTNWATHWERGQFIGFISPVRSEIMWNTWNNSYLNCGCGWKWRMIIAVNFQFKQLERRSLKKSRLHSSVGRASHRYRGGHGFESRWSPDFFRLLLSSRLN